MQLKVSTVNLSPDLRSIAAEHGVVERGEMDAAALSALLETFMAGDAAQNHEHDPQVIVRTPAAKFLIRTSGRQLHLYNARDVSQPAAVLTLPALLEAIASPGLSAGPAPEEPETFMPVPVRGKNRGALTALLLLLGVGLNAWGIYQFLDRTEETPPPPYTAITDEAKVGLLRRQLAGSYATGAEPGDRVIVLTPAGEVKFQLLVAAAGNAPAVAEQSADTCLIGRRRDGLHCLVTTTSGQVDLRADGSLSYYGDTYRRITAPAK
jgi:hypothetical protein